MTRWALFSLAACFLMLAPFNAVMPQERGTVAQEAAGSPVAKPAGEMSLPQKPEGENAKGRKAPVVVTETVGSTEIRRILELTGEVVPTRTARMASPGEGPIQNCTVREGDRVKQGARVVTIGRNLGTQAQLAAAVAALKEQEQDLGRIKQLVENGAIPGAQLDTARAKYESARAQVAKARESADDYRVSAPWDGIVSKVLVQDGDYVAPRTPLVEMFDPESLVVRFAVPEVSATEIRTGMKALVQLDAHGGKSFEGSVSHVYPELDSRMRTRLAEVVLHEKIELIPGMFARITLLFQTLPHAVTIPTEALLKSPQGESFVFVVEEGKVIRRRVETGIDQGGRTQVLRGIQPGDRIVVAGHEKLKDGTEVRLSTGAVQ